VSVEGWKRNSSALRKNVAFRKCCGNVAEAAEDVGLRKTWRGTYKEESGATTEKAFLSVVSGN